MQQYEGQNTNEVNKSRKPQVGIYCRLSQEDRNKERDEDDSESIKNQKRMLTEYAVLQDWDVYGVYSDDDYSGTDHSRPEFNRLLNDSKDGKIDIILCKTQSRFTRDMSDVELYLHTLFPQWGVRFVSLTDSADTSVKANKKSRQINAMLNEWYLEDMSENIKAVRHSQQLAGQFVGAFAPYGYKKDPNNKHHLIIDEPAAEVVRKIYSLYIQGYGKKTIAAMLNEQGILCPSVYKNEHGLEYKNQHNKSDLLWRDYSITDILTNEVYIGNTVQNKTHSESFKTKNTVPTPKDEWVRVENTHEAIIDKPTWELSRSIAEDRKTPGVSTSTINIFSGKLECGICGGNLGRHKNGSIISYNCYVHRYDSCRCKGNTITEKLLHETVLSEFQARIAELVDPERVTNGVKVKNNMENRIETLKEELKLAEHRRDSVLKSNKLLLSQLAEGTISEARYNALTQSFDADLEMYERAIVKGRKDIEKVKEQQMAIKSQSEIAKKYLELTKLDNIIVNLFIDKIVVMPKKPYSRVANLRIYWKF